MTDSTLVNALLAYRGDILRAATAITGRAEDAEDVLQEVLLRGLHAAPSPDRPLRPWVLRVARNLSVDRVRARAAADRAAALPDPEPAPPAAVDDLANGLGRFLDRLTDAQRAVVLARDVLGASVEEAAAAIGSTAASVKNLHLRARRALQGDDAAAPERVRAALDAILLAGTRRSADEGAHDPFDNRFPAWFRCDLATRLAVLEGAVELADRAGDPALAARALWSRGMVRGRGDTGRARRDLERAAALARSAAPELAGGIGLSLGVVQAYQGALREAASNLAGAAEALQDQRDTGGEAAALTHLGWVQGERGALDRAAGHLERALEVGGQSLSASGRAVAMHHLANLRLLQGRAEECRVLATEAAALAQGCGDRHNTAAALANLAMAASDARSVDEALTLLGQGLALVRAEGNAQQEGVFLGNLGVVLLRGGREEEAAAALTRGLERSKGATDRRSVAIARANLGVLAHAVGDRREAARLLHRARAEAERLDLRRLVRFVVAHEALLVGLVDPEAGCRALVPLAADAEGASDPRLQRLLVVVTAAIRGEPRDPEGEPFTEAAIAAALARTARLRLPPVRTALA